jgi:hypothetical protein
MSIVPAKHNMNDGPAFEVALRDLLQTIPTTRNLDEDVFQMIVHLILLSRDHSTHLRGKNAEEISHADCDDARSDCPRQRVTQAMNTNNDNDKDTHKSSAVGRTVIARAERKRDRAVTFVKKALPFIGIVSGLMGLGATIDGLVEDNV